MIHISGFAQTKYVYEENFDGSTNWPSVDNNERTLKMYNGRYYFEHKRDKDFWQVTTTSFNFDASKDFEIETSIQKISGVGNTGISFAYDFKDNNNYKEFGIATDGFFRVSEAINGEYKTLKAWTESDKVKKGNYGVNILKITKKSNTLTYYVNGNSVHTETYKTFVGNKMSFILYKDQKISIDYIRVKYLSNSNSTNTLGKTILFDGFTDNKNNWAIKNTNEVNLELAKGDYSIDHKRDKGGWSSTIPKYIDKTRRYRITGQFKKVSGINNNGYGLVFGRKDNDNQNQFFISGDGSFIIKKTENGTTTYPKNWTKSSHIKTGNGTTNYLKVEKNVGNYKFYINSKLVYTNYETKSYGDRVGLITYGRQKISLGYLSIAYLDGNTNTIKKNTVSLDNIFTENFDSNTNNWSTSSDENVDFNLSNGKYYLNYKKTEKGWLTHIEKYFDSSKNFEIETKLSHISGDTNAPYGFIWGKDGTNYFQFLLTSTGYYKVARVVNNKSTDIVKYTKTSSINKGSINNNVLKIKKEGDYYRFYINNNYVTKIDFEPFYGNQLGYGIYFKQKISVDYLKIKQTKEKKNSNFISNKTLSVPLFDNFDRNTNNWGIENSTNYSVALNNGDLILSRKTKGGIFVSKDVEINTAKDFIIETSLKEKNTSDGFYGITFGRKNSSNEYSFLLSGNGKYKYRKFDDNNYKEIIPLTSSNAIKVGANEVNKIKIVKSGNLLRFYINDQYLNETPFESFFGNKLGYTIYYNRKIAAEYLDVKYQTASYNNPPVVTISEPNVTLKRGFKIVEAKKILVKGTATDSDGIYEITVNGIEANVSENGNFSVNVPLKYGKNTLVVKATDIKQSSSTKTFIIKRKSSNTDQNIIVDNDNKNEKLDIGFGKYYALIIGVSNYEDETIQDLKGEPTKDAQSLAEVLTSKYSFAKENVTVLKNPTENQINREFIKLSRKVRSNDNLVIFYAGHGNYDKTTEKGYWMPSNANMEFEENIILNTSIVTYIKAIKSKHTLLISDACFSGSILTTSRSFKTASKAVQKKYELPSRKAITSGTLTTVPNQSVFMKYLLKRLNQNTDKYLSAGQLFNMIEDPVINNTTGDNQPQYAPISRTGDEGGDFIFIKRN